MKTALLCIVSVVLASALTTMIVSQRLTARHAAELATQQAAWQQEKADLESALQSAKGTERLVVIPGAPAGAAAPAPAPARDTPADIVARLRALKFGPGASQTRATRQAIHDLEELIAAGSSALPAIREFFARNEDIEFPSTQGKGGRGAVPDEFILPPSLRFGLLDVVKQVGGADAEKVLAEVLGTTGRGAEVAWVARALHQLAPNQYRDAALAAARELLARAPIANPASPLDRGDRDHLFSVLAMYGDDSYVSTAQAQLIQPDGAIDRSALKYLQQLLGQQTVAIAAQTWNDPRLTDPAKKEPLARLALNFVGADPQANEFYQKAINDLNLPKDDRKNLIEDLNQDGFVNKKNLDATDLPLINNRIALIEQLAPTATDPINVAAFKEAYKDLLKMRERIVNPPPPVVPPK
ncbi:MAG TPA: hypothetical protein VGF13_10255 [Verrucomicrobiae bacterium]|jgi:hypothetical protein